MTSGSTAATAAALTATLELAAAAWVVAVRQMNGMDMGVATQLGSFGFFAALWVSMMAVMMLPGAAPAVVRRTQVGGGVHTVPLFVGSYLVIWTLVGVAVLSVTWMTVIALVVLAQKLLPAKAGVNVPLAVAIVGLGILIIIAPSSIPGLSPPM